MKVCLAVMGEKDHSKEMLTSDFYKSDYYCIYDLDKNEMNYFRKSENGMNYLSIDKLKSWGVEAIITPNLRPMARKILFEAAIEVYKSIGNLVDENLRLLKKESLKPFSDEMIEQGKSCNSSSCSTCSTTCN